MVTLGETKEVIPNGTSCAVFGCTKSKKKLSNGLVVKLGEEEAWLCGTCRRKVQHRVGKCTKKASVGNGASVTRRGRGLELDYVVSWLKIEEQRKQLDQEKTELLEKEARAMRAGRDKWHRNSLWKRL